MSSGNNRSKLAATQLREKFNVSAPVPVLRLIADMPSVPNVQAPATLGLNDLKELRVKSAPLLLAKLDEQSELVSSEIDDFAYYFLISDEEIASKLKQINRMDQVADKVRFLAAVFAVPEGFMQERIDLFCQDFPRLAGKYKLTSGTE